MIIQNNQFPSNNKDCVLNIQGIADTNDKSPSAHTVTNNGVTITTPANLNFNSMLFDGTSSLSVSHNTSFDFGTDDLTISGWVNFANTGTEIIATKRVDANNYWHIYYAAGAIVFRFYVGGTWVGAYSAAFTPTINTWYHLGCSRSNLSVIKGIIAIDGILLSVDEIVPFGTNNSNIPAAPIMIGNQTSLYFAGSMSNFMIHTQALYTRNFTPPNRIA